MLLIDDKGQCQIVPVSYICLKFAPSQNTVLIAIIMRKNCLCLEMVKTSEQNELIDTKTAEKAIKIQIYWPSNKL